MGSYLADAKGKPLKTIAALPKGRQPKQLQLVSAKNGPMAVDVTAKAMGGAGKKARTLIVAKPRLEKSAPAKTPAKTKATVPSSLTAQILSATSNGIIALDRKGRITLANPATAELLNRDAAAMQGMPVERAFVYGSAHFKAGTPVPIMAQLSEGRHFADRDVQLAKSDGESFEAVYVLVPATENRKVTSYVITFRDVTRRRRAKAEMRIAGVVLTTAPKASLSPTPRAA